MCVIMRYIESAILTRRKSLVHVPTEKWDRDWIWPGHFQGGRRNATIRLVDDKLKTASFLAKAINGATPGLVEVDYCNGPLLEKHVKYDFYSHADFTAWLHFHLKALQRGDPSVVESNLIRLASPARLRRLV